MRILIDNYSSLLGNNQCLAMSEYMKSIGNEVYLDSTFSSPYYKLSTLKPDWYFTSDVCMSEDFVSYINNEICDTVFIVSIRTNTKLAQVVEIQDVLEKSKKKYKLLLNNNFGHSGYVMPKKQNTINFSGFQTELLKTEKENRWNTSFDFLLIGGNSQVDLKILNNLRDSKFKFHTHLTSATKAAELTLPLMEYKEILCNYKAFVFYDNRADSLGQDFYDVCYLRKPVYLLSNYSQKTTKKSLGLDIDISFENRDNNIDFELLHNNIAKEFSIKKQLDKLMSHIPKPKK